MITAAFQSQCPTCSGVVFEGAEIAQDASGQWVCAECAKPKPVIPAQQTGDMSALLAALGQVPAQTTSEDTGPADPWAYTETPGYPNVDQGDPATDAALAEFMDSNDPGPKDSVDAGEAETESVPHSTRIWRQVTLPDGTKATARVTAFTEAAGISNPFVELADKVAAEPSDMPEDLIPRLQAVVDRVQAEQVPGQLAIEVPVPAARPAYDPFPETTPEATVTEEPPFEEGPPVTDLTDFADRIRTLKEAKAEQTEFTRRANMAKELAAEIQAELDRLGITTDGDGNAVITVNGVPALERKVSKGTRLDQAKWKAKNTSWKTGRYAEEYTTVRWVPVGDDNPEG